eukprot:gene27246-2501_t
MPKNEMKFSMIYPPCLTLGESTTISIQFSISRSLSKRERQRIKATKGEASRRRTNIQQERPESIAVLMTSAGGADILINELHARRGTNEFQLNIPPISTPGVVHLVLISRSEPQVEEAVDTHCSGSDDADASTCTSPYQLWFTGPCVTELAGLFSQMTMLHISPTDLLSQQNEEQKEQEGRDSMDSLSGSGFAVSNIGQRHSEAELHTHALPGSSTQLWSSSGDEEEALGSMPLASDNSSRNLADSRQGCGTETGDASIHARQRRKLGEAAPSFNLIFQHGAHNAATNEEMAMAVWAWTEHFMPVAKDIGTQCI